MAAPAAHVAGLVIEEETAVYIRIIKGQTKPGQSDELARRWEGFIAGRLAGMPGFHHAHFGVDRAANTTAAVSVWDELPDEATTECLMGEFRSQIADIVSGPPTIENYEVLAEAQPR